MIAAVVAERKRTRRHCHLASSWSPGRPSSARHSKRRHELERRRRALFGTRPGGRRRPISSYPPIIPTSCSASGSAQAREHSSPTRPRGSGRTARASSVGHGVSAPELVGYHHRASAIGRDVTEKKRVDAALPGGATLPVGREPGVAAAHEINNPLTSCWVSFNCSP